MAAGCVTDKAAPSFSFSLDSDRQGAELKRAVIRVGDWERTTTEQIALEYDGKPLEPYSTYKAELTVWDDVGENAQAELTFETGRLSEPWTAKWITDGDYHFTEKKVSPVPMTFRQLKVYLCREIP